MKIEDLRFVVRRRRTVLQFDDFLLGIDPDTGCLMLVTGYRTALAHG
jgi:hypothetical protein